MTDLIGPTSHTYISQRLRLHYVDWGNPDAPPLLLLHGGRDHCRSWDWAAQALRHDWHVIAPDLRGHGDSAWSSDGGYALSARVYDLAQLIDQLQLSPVNIVAHSLGGMTALRYAGAFPDHVARLVVIEGLSMPPRMRAERAAMSPGAQLRQWVDAQRTLAARTPRRYGNLQQALERMQKENERLTDEQARHLTVHGVARNEDGTFTWKFDNYVRFRDPADLSDSDIHTLWSGITCPTLLVHGRESWAPDPMADGSLAKFRNARLAWIEGAGHWPHHDRLAEFLAEVRGFLSA